MGMVAWALLSYAGATLPVLIGFAVIWGTSAGIGAQAFYSVWTSELFATRFRATAQGVLFFAARCAVGGLSYVFPTLLTNQGVPFVGHDHAGLARSWRWWSVRSGRRTRRASRCARSSGSATRSRSALTAELSVEARATSSGWNTTCWCRCCSSVVSASSSWAAVRPSSSRGCRTEVSGTAAAEANSMSSYPTMARSPGTRQPGADGLLEQAERDDVVGAERRGRTAGGGEAGEPLAGAAALGDGERGGGQLDQVLGGQPGLAPGRAARRRSGRGPGPSELGPPMKATRVWPWSMRCSIGQPAAEHVVDGDRAEPVVVAGAVDDHQRDAALGDGVDPRGLRVDRGQQDAQHALLHQLRRGGPARGRRGCCCCR